uniref:Uncharacterized protein n=1 Tax=Tetraselmis sp. GSL018 TaxID=582737 RepID=A0A061R7K8_9CHLO|mmetsp:Transcript_8797/g.21251  ORF Transcript_8797/g.21251 Transcript_8797/m.21251 type:complete len:237 (+) Transcript_8797:346-1056(+)
MSSKECGTTDGFGGRDLAGLLPAAKAKTEKEERQMYFKMIGSLILFWGPLIATSIYLAICYIFPGQSEIFQTKLDFIRRHDLGWVYAAWFVANLAKAYVSINANGARGPARLDRPDQHIYQVMAQSGPLATAPYVLMATEGPAGRFNRAQRAAANLDEGMPLFLTGLLLQGAVFGPLACCLALLYLYSTCRFAEGYKAGSKQRMAGFMLMALPVQLSGSLVALVAFQTLVRPMLQL